MNARPFLTKISDKIVNIYKDVYGEKLHSVYLYGSYATGQETSESDIDYVAIVNDTRDNINNALHSVWDKSVDIDIDYDVVTSTLAISQESFGRNKYLPYYKNIAVDGVLLFTDKSA